MLALPVLALFPPRPLIEALVMANPEVLFEVDTDHRAVALTFDDGPNSEITPRILDLLAEHEAHATFFLIGDRMSGNEKLMDRMRVEGHELGNHMAHDESSISLSTSSFERQLMWSDSLLAASASAQGGQGKWFRPGSGWFNRRMIRQLADHGYRIALGSVYPHDLLTKSPSLIGSIILGRVDPGSVLILHDGDVNAERTVRVLELVLPVLKARGYEILTLSELADLDGGKS